MQDVTGKVSLGTHFISLDIYYGVRSPHCHELWAPASLGNVCFPAKCPSLKLRAGFKHFLQVDEANVGSTESLFSVFCFSPDCGEEQREQLEPDDPRHAGDHPQQSRQSPGSHVR